jgi:hypothetical protein
VEYTAKYLNTLLCFIFSLSQFFGHFAGTMARRRHRPCRHSTPPRAAPVATLIYSIK